MARFPNPALLVSLAPGDDARDIVFTFTGGNPSACADPSQVETTDDNGTQIGDLAFDFSGDHFTVRFPTDMEYPTDATVKTAAAVTFTNGAYLAANQTIPVIGGKSDNIVGTVGNTVLAIEFLSTVTSNPVALVTDGSTVGQWATNELHPRSPISKAIVSGKLALTFAAPVNLGVEIVYSGTNTLVFANGGGYFPPWHLTV